MAKQASYTAEMEARMAEVFDAEQREASVATLSAELGKSTKSVVAKLAQLGLYVSKAKEKAKGERATKATRAEQLAVQLQVMGVIEMGAEVERVAADLAKLRVESLAALEVVLIDRA